MRVLKIIEEASEELLSLLDKHGFQSPYIGPDQFGDLTEVTIDGTFDILAVVEAFLGWLGDQDSESFIKFLADIPER